MVGDARAYAATLAVLEQRRALAPQAALAATGGNLIERIRRLTTEPRRARTSAAPAVSAGIMLVLFAAALAAWPAKAPVERRPRTALPVAGAALQTSPAAQDQLVAFRAAAADAQDQLVAFRAAAADAQQTPAAPMTGQERRAKEKALREELATPFRKWLAEDVAYIIADEERAAFLRLQTDGEREQFIENFWLRRDSTPGTIENEFKEEHYRRIAYANEHYASGIPGWKTDRGRVYITYGPPDEIEDHSSIGSETYPFQQWRYRYIEGIGTNIIIEFVDPTRSGEYRMTVDPSMVALAATRRPDQFVKTSVSQDGAVVIGVHGRPSTAQPGVIAAGDTLSLGLSSTGGPPNAAAGNRILTPLATVRSDGVISVPFAGDVLAAGLTPSQLDAALVPALSGRPIQQTRGVQILQLVTVQVPLDFPYRFHVFGELTTPSQKIVQTFEVAVNKQQAVSRVIPLAPGSYRLTVVVKNQMSGVTRNSALDFTVD
jgi:GWxTD domain-containing protein